MNKRIKKKVAKGISRRLHVDGNVRIFYTHTKDKNKYIICTKPFVHGVIEDIKYDIEEVQ